MSLFALNQRYGIIRSCANVVIVIGTVSRCGLTASCYIRDLLKQTQCVRTVSMNLLYRWHKHHLLQSEIKEGGMDDRKLMHVKCFSR